MKELLHSSEFDGFPLDLHQAMVRDEPRMEQFDAALRALVRAGDTVVDVGSGTGILALMAWRAGAGRVIAIEKSEIIEPARRFIAQRYPEAPIEFLRLDVEREALPAMQADVLVCELLGNLGPEERIVPVLSKLCANVLKTGGHVIPGSVELMAVPVAAPAVASELGRWNEPVAGFDLSVFDALARQRVYHLQGEALSLLAAPTSYRTLQFGANGVAQEARCASFEILEPGVLHGFACWFEASLAPGHTMSSAPGAPVTHWGQVFFPLEDLGELARGDRVSFELTTDGDEFEVQWTWSGTLQRAGQAPSKFRMQASGSA